MLLSKMTYNKYVCQVRSSFHHWGTRTKNIPDFTEPPFFALSDGDTSQTANVVERSARAGACGLSSIVFNQMQSATYMGEFG